MSLKRGMELGGFAQGRMILAGEYHDAHCRSGDLALGAPLKAVNLSFLLTEASLAPRTVLCGKHLLRL